MPVSTWLKKIWKAIKSFFTGIPTEIKNAIHIGVSVTENIKNFVESPVADILTAIIPGEIDDKIKVALKAQLPIILTQLRLADNCSKTSSFESITLCAIYTLQSLNKNTKNAFLHNLSILIAQVAADGKLNWQDAASVMEWYYQQQYKVRQ